MTSTRSQSQAGVGGRRRGAAAGSAPLPKLAASDRFEHIFPSPSKSSALANYAEAAVQTGDCDAASILHELIEPWSDQVVSTYIQGYGHARMWLCLLAATLGKHDEADRHLAFACEFHETNALPLWAARGHLGWAEALAGRGDAGAQEHAALALELSREHGYGVFDARAAVLVGAQSAAEA